MWITVKRPKYILTYIIIYVIIVCIKRLDCCILWFFSFEFPQYIALESFFLLTFILEYDMFPV